MTGDSHRLCPKCGSTGIKAATVKPPRVKKRGDRESKTMHVCIAACEQTVQFCTSCRFATPLPVGVSISEIPGQRAATSRSARKA